MQNPAVRVATGVLKRFGFEIIRTGRGPALPALPPPLRSSPIEALLSNRMGERTAFLCPVDRIVMLNGFGFDPAGWHPFSATLSAYRNEGVTDYESSILDRYYARWQPACAANAVVGFESAPDCLAAAPAHAYHFTPWSPISLDQEIGQIEAYYAADYREHGATELRLEVDGFKFHGPVSNRLGRVEFQRLQKILTAIEQSRYDRRHGDVNVYMLRRNGETRFVCRGGVHRVAAMATIGHPEVPARLCAPYLVDLCEIDGWPQVLAGMWTREQAEHYFHHLFDFNARTWAREVGLVD